MENHSQVWARIFPLVYVCNCNGIRERQVRAAIEAGATRPREIFARNQCANAY